MFKLATKHIFWWPVTVNTPDPDKPGAFVANTFEAQFEAVDVLRADEIDFEVRKRPGYDRAANGDDYIMEVTHDWRHVVEEDESPVPFSREQLTALMRLSWFRRGIVTAYTEAMSGQAARLGN